VARLFQRSAACVTVGALGPKAQHFLHATNFGSMSPLIQTSESPQKGQGCSGGTETGNPRGRGRAALSPGLPGMQPPVLTAIERCVDCSSPIRPIHRIQFGIDLVEETLNFVALVRTGIFFESAQQVLLFRQQHCNARH
jgi:hypothetical protein